MKLEQNLFMLHRVLVSKNAWFLWCFLAIAITAFITIELYMVSLNPQAYDMTPSLIQYYNKVRKMQQLNQIKQQTQNNANSQKSTQGKNNQNNLNQQKTIDLKNSQQQSQKQTKQDQKSQYYYSLVKPNALLSIIFKQIPNQQSTLNKYNSITQAQKWLLKVNVSQATTEMYSAALLYSNINLHRINLSQSFRNKHNISLDTLWLQPPQLPYSLFLGRNYEQTRQNELLIRSLSFSLSRLADQDLLKLGQQSDIKKVSSQLGLIIHRWDAYKVQKLLKNSYPNIVLRILFLLVIFSCLLLTSEFLGLVVRLLIFLMFSILNLLQCSNNWGFIYYFSRMILNAVPKCTARNFMLLVLFVTAAFVTYFLLIYGLYHAFYSIHHEGWLFFGRVSNPIYGYTLLHNLLLIQIFHYFFVRSRITIRYFPLISMIFSCAIVGFMCRFRYLHGLWFLNLHLYLHLLLFTCVLMVQSTLLHQELLQGTDFIPSMMKPRLLFYIGYDISWQKQIPPLWTYFTVWNDLSYFNEVQKSYIERDYQLLYGHLLGMNGRLQIPQEEENHGLMNENDEIHNEESSNSDNMIGN